MYCIVAYVKMSISLGKLGFGAEVGALTRMSLSAPSRVSAPPHFQKISRCLPRNAYAGEYSSFDKKLFVSICTQYRAE